MRARKLKLPLRAFLCGDVVEIQDAKDRCVIKWTGFEASDFDIQVQRRIARELVEAVNAKAVTP